MQYQNLIHSPLTFISSYQNPVNACQAVIASRRELIAPCCNVMMSGRVIATSRKNVLPIPCLHTQGLSRKPLTINVTHQDLNLKQVSLNLNAQALCVTADDAVYQPPIRGGNLQSTQDVYADTCGIDLWQLVKTE